MRLIEAAKVPTILTIDASAENKPPAKLIGASFEVVHFYYMSPVQSMLAYHHFFGRPAPAVMQTFKTLTPAIFTNLKTIIDQTGVALSDEEIVEKLHRRVGEYKATGLVPVNITIGYSDAPEQEIAAAKLLDYRRNGSVLLLPRGVPLTLEERYGLLKKLPKAIKWRDVASLVVEPDRAAQSATPQPTSIHPTVH